MSRYAPKMSVKDLHSKLSAYMLKYFEEDMKEEIDDPNDTDSIIEWGLMDHQFPKVHSDIQKIKFDYENVHVERYLELTNGVPIALVSAGGDWEYPVLFALYFDGSTFRGYTPTEGNIFNRTLKQAYGNADESVDSADALKYFGVEDYNKLEPEFAKAISDIDKRIKSR